MGKLIDLDCPKCNSKWRTVLWNTTEQALCPHCNTLYDVVITFSLKIVEGIKK